VTRRYSKDRGYRAVPLGELLQHGALGMASGSDGD